MKSSTASEHAPEGLELSSSLWPQWISGTTVPVIAGSTAITLINSLMLNFICPKEEKCRYRKTRE
jgi:hypothetical protein